MTKLNLFTDFNYIYPGPHIDSKGKLDNRVFFLLPLEREDDKITCLKFPSNALEEEIEFTVIDASDLWMP